MLPEINDAFENLALEIKELINDEATKPATEQIEELRNEFEDILEELKIKLVVLVDDLDRCCQKHLLQHLKQCDYYCSLNTPAFCNCSR